MTDSREAIRRAAGQLFAERGYAAVTIREIAARAGVSPALVIKLHGSKAELYAEVGPGDLRLGELGVPPEHLGRAMVLFVLNRRRRGDPEPWCALVGGVRDAPSAEAGAAHLADAVQAVIELIGDTTDGHPHASAIICQMIGLAEGLRVLDLFPTETASSDDVVAMFAPGLQAQVDACRSPDRR